MEFSYTALTDINESCVANSPRPGVLKVFHAATPSSHQNPLIILLQPSRNYPNAIPFRNMERPDGCATWHRFATLSGRCDPQIQSPCSSKLWNPQLKALFSARKGSKISSLEFSWWWSMKGFFKRGAVLHEAVENTSQHSVDKCHCSQVTLKFTTLNLTLSQVAINQE